jgi:hypothetical protein
MRASLQHVRQRVERLACDFRMSGSGCAGTRITAFM